MLHQELLDSQYRFHKIYQERIASANGRQKAMERDIADFDKGIELLLQGRSHRACRKEMVRFSTVVSWIIGRNLPESFRDRNVEVVFKKIDTDELSESSNFAYILGVYQAKVKSIHPERLTITADDSSLVREVEKCFNAIHMKHSKKTVVFSNDKHAQRIYYDSLKLMSYISEITEGNTRIPRIFFFPNLMRSYISGFFDARAVPCYTSSKVKCSGIERKYPRIIVTKKSNKSLLSAVNSSLLLLGINSRYDPHINPSQIKIDALESIRKCIDFGLFRCAKKMCKIKELYDYWKDTKELDHYGAYQKLKEEIRMQREENKPGAYIEKEYEDEPEEIESEPADEDLLEEDF